MFAGSTHATAPPPARLTAADFAVGDWVGRPGVMGGRPAGQVHGFQGERLTVCWLGRPPVPAEPGELVRYPDGYGGRHVRTAGGLAGVVTSPGSRPGTVFVAWDGFPAHLPDAEPSLVRDLIFTGRPGTTAGERDRFTDTAPAPGGQRATVREFDGDVTTQEG